MVQRPASMWQPACKTFAFHQGNFGAGYPKPTRLLIFAREAFRLPSFCYEGPPTFDDKGFYLGATHVPATFGLGILCYDSFGGRA